MIIQGVFHHEGVGDETLNKSLNKILSTNILFSMANIKDGKEWSRSYIVLFPIQ